MFGLDYYSTWMLVVVVLGYILITLEHFIKVNKAVSALLMGVIVWVIEFGNEHIKHVDHINIFGEHLSDIAELVIFFVAILAIAEMINSQNGFSVVERILLKKSKKGLFWTAGAVSFFLSVLLGSIATSIVVISIIGKLLFSKEDRWLVGAGVVIAANAGGAFSTIGDITTTMLWFGGKLTTLPTLGNLFLPSFSAWIGSFLLLQMGVKGKIEKQRVEKGNSQIFFLGLLMLVLIPALKILGDLPPFMGALLGLSVLWFVSDCMGKEKKGRALPSIIWQIDLSGTIFFLGILLTVDALQTAGILEQFARYLGDGVEGNIWVGGLTGLAAGLINSVPLVAGYLGMFSFGLNDPFWHMLAYAAGVGGSIFIYGSAPGVALMGLEGVHFGWFLRRVSFSAFFGYMIGLIIEWLWIYQVSTVLQY